MWDEAKEILNTVIDFCRDKTTAILIAGGLLIVLIIIISAVRSSHKDDDEDFDFDEEFFGEAKEEDSLEIQSSDKSEPVAAELCRDESKTEKEVDSSDSGESASEYIESILEELSEISAKTLEEVEIKINGAEFKLKYSKGQPSDMPSPQAEDTGESLKTCESDPDAACEGKSREDIDTERYSDLIPKKFGPGNEATTRMGRTYTEEELEKTIRD